MTSPRSVVQGPSHVDHCGELSSLHRQPGKTALTEWGKAWRGLIGHLERKLEHLAVHEQDLPFCSYL